MPFQQIQLDQSIYQRPPWKKETQQRSPISQALRPQGGGVGGYAAGVPSDNSFVEEQKAKWAEEDKLKKAERDRQMQANQEMGMRIRAAAEAEKERGRQMSAQAAQQRTLAQAQQQGAQRQQIEDNPEPAAKEIYELMKTLPDEIRDKLLQQMFTPTAPKGTMTSAGKTVTMPEKYNPIADVMMSKGWATIDVSGKPVLSEPEREFEKGTFKEMSDGSILNEATGEVIVRAVDMPEGFTAKEIADGLNYGRLYMGSLTEPTLLEKITPEKMGAFMDNAREESRKATENYLYALGRGKGLTRKQAHNIAYGLSDTDLGGGGGTTTTGRSAPLDEEKAKGLADYLKDNPNTNIEAYRDRDGDATVDRALEIMGKKTEPTTTITKPIKKEEVKEELKVKDYFKGFPNLPYYP